MTVYHQSNQLIASNHDVEKRFLKLKGLVLDQKPVLKEILHKRGNKKLYQYSLDYIEVNVNPPIKQRQDEFLKTFYKEVSTRLGDDVAKNATKQLEKYYYVSTADHLGPISHPFFLNSNLIAIAPYFENKDPLLNNVIVLACARPRLWESR